MSDHTEYQVPRLMHSVANLETRVAELELLVDALIGIIELEAGYGVSTEELRKKLKERRG